MNCSICDGSLKKCITCPSCSHESCVNCNKKYIMTKTDPQCMSCNIIWSDIFLETNFSLNFINKNLRVHMDEVIFQQEKSMFDVACREIEARKNQEERERLNTEYNLCLNRIEERKWQSTIYRKRIEHARANIVPDENRTFKQREIYERDLKMLQNQLSDCLDTVIFYEKKLKIVLLSIEQFNSSVSDKLEIASVSIRCPKEKCIGYLNSNYNCPVCKISYCRDCQLKTDSTHVCDQNLVKTLKSIQKNTKPCPSCKIPIEKLAGCDQMFCTYCNTPFNWISGEIEKGRIHNPHYNEWVQRGGGRPLHENLEECGQRINQQSIMALFSKKEKEKDTEHELYNFEEFMLTMLRLIIHIEDVKIRSLTQADVRNRHLELRIKYINGMLTEEIWKAELSKGEKEYQFKNKQRMLWETCRTVLKDILNCMFNEKNIEKYNYYCKQVNTFLEYFNNESKTMFSKQNRRLYEGIDTLKFVEKTSPLVINESPQNFQKNFFDKEPEWLDETEQIYYNIFTYYKDINKKKFEKEEDYLLNAICNNDVNIKIIQLQTIISGRIRSHVKTRIDVLEYIWRAGIKSQIDYFFRTCKHTQITWTRPEITITGSWTNLCFLTSNFPYYLFEFIWERKKYIPNENPYANSITYKGQTHTHNCLTNLVLIGLYFRDDCTQLTDQEMWTSLYNKLYTVNRFYQNAKNPIVTYFENFERDLIHKLYTRLANSPKYTRKITLQKEYSYIRTIIKWREDLTEDEENGETTV